MLLSLYGPAGRAVIPGGETSPHAGCRREAATPCPRSPTPRCIEESPRRQMTMQLLAPLVDGAEAYSEPVLPTDSAEDPQLKAYAHGAFYAAETPSVRLNGRFAAVATFQLRRLRIGLGEGSGRARGGLRACPSFFNGQGPGELPGKNERGPSPPAFEPQREPLEHHVARGVETHDGGRPVDRLSR